MCFLHNIEKIRCLSKVFMEEALLVWRLYGDSVESIILWRFYGKISLEIVWIKNFKSGYQTISMLILP